MSTFGGSVVENLNDLNYTLSRQHSLPAFDVNLNGSIRQSQKTIGASGDSSSTTSSGRGKHAAMEIYRPPSLRSGDGKGRLNVHAKEFVMNHNTAKSNGDTFKSERIYPLNSSKSSGNVMLSSQFKSNDNEKFVSDLSSTNSSNFYDLQRAKSSGSVLLENHNTGSKVQFKIPSPEKMPQKPSPIKEKKLPNFGQSSAGLKRSKSFSAADAFMELEALTLPTSTMSFTEYHLFPTKLHGLIRQAVENANQMSDKNKIILGRTVVEHALTDKKIAYPAAKLSVLIMDQDKSSAYLDSLMNTCQMLYQTKKTSVLADSAKFKSFLAFLLDLYSELKRSKTQLKKMSDSPTPPKIVFLLLIARCCEDILVRNNKHSLPEIECLFHALTSVGRDIQLELPNMFALLFHIVREVLLKSCSGPEVQKTLLQLIELRAANWQLPISALNYYYPKASNI